MLASTSSSASRCSSSLGEYSGDRGNAIKPVLVDSRIPKGPMSFMKESILEGFADLDRVSMTVIPNLLAERTPQQCSYSC